MDSFEENEGFTETRSSLCSSPALDEGEGTNSADEKGFSVDEESVVESRSSPPAEVKPSEALPGGQAKHPSKHECAVCEKRFATKGVLTLHIRTFHEKRADFMCEICLKCFTRKEHLKEHVLSVHEKRADFKCEILSLIHI